MARKAYPEFHKALMEQSAYPVAPRRIKFDESRHSYFYRTGAHVYKIRKTSHIYSSPAIKERYAQEALRLGQHWAGDVVEAVLPIVRTAEGHALGAPGDPVEYALRMVQLSDTYWLSRLIAVGKFTPALVGRLARFLAERHQALALQERAADAGRPEHLHGLLEEVTYQTKKYVGITANEALLELVTRPLGRFLEDTRKLTLRRMKRGRIVDGHGAFVPEHVYLRGTDLRAIGPLDGQAKFRMLDAAHDVGQMVNSLILAEQPELAELFVKRYVTASKDRDLPRMLPLYRVLHAMREGLLRSEWLVELEAEHPDRVALADDAARYFHLAGRTARDLLKSA